MNKNTIIILMIVGYVMFMLGFISFSIFGIAISFTGGMMFLILLIYLGVKIRNSKNVLSKLLIIIPSIVIFALIINCIVVIRVILNR